ncbi:carbon-nitrogen hydrolase family protein [Rudaea sp.]|uniref:carbon-nitrogen hydrolase family protein n=1 Tax=Rudaea sp. TaxID=2136325 RepID=UPI002ED3F2C1
MKIALAQWRIEAPASFQEFAARVFAEIAVAVKQGASIVVLPEYLALELASTLDAKTRADFPATLAALQAVHVDWLRLFAGLAVAHRIHLLAGTFLLEQPNGKYRNRAYLFSPDGSHVFQDKLTLTGFENAAGVIEPGDALKVFESRYGRIAIDICYDSEFPLYARAQREAGARLLLVPSCTDTEAGASRVRIGCMARALENRIYVAQSVTAGEAPDNPALDTNTGRAAVYAPSDRGLPDDGLVAAATPGETWLIADVDLAALEATAANAQVAVPVDWGQQSRPGVVRAKVETL